MPAFAVTSVNDYKLFTFSRIWALSRRYFGSLRALVKNRLISCHPSGKHQVCGLFKRNIGKLLAGKVSKQKTFPIYQSTSRLSIIKLYYRKRCEIWYSTVTKTNSIIKRAKKSAYETLKQFFILQIVFELFCTCYSGY